MPEYPVAYCAPGRKTLAALTLMLRGEQVAEITEHPWMEGRTDCIVVREDPQVLLSSDAFRAGITGPSTDAIRFRWEQDMLMRTVRRPPLPPSALVSRA